MANKVSQTFFLPVIVSANLFIPSTIWSAEAKESKAVNKDLAKELLKKYGSYRPKEILYLKDSMASNERVNLDNEYFKISFPKCFVVEPTVEDSEDVTIKNSASLDINRTKKCSNFDSEADANRMQLFFNSSYINPELLEKVESASKASYRQMIDINGALGVIHMGVGISPEWNHQGELVAGWTAVIGCKGKKNEMFQFTFLVARNNKAIEIIKSKKFELPEDFKQIISSFQCRKDR